MSRLREITAVHPRDAFHGAERSLIGRRGRFDERGWKRWNTSNYVSEDHPPLRGWVYGHFHFEEPTPVAYVHPQWNQPIDVQERQQVFFLGVKTRLVKGGKKRG